MSEKNGDERPDNGRKSGDDGKGGQADGPLKPIPEPEEPIEAEKVEDIPAEDILIGEKVDVGPLADGAGGPSGPGRQLEQSVDRALKGRMDLDAIREAEGRMEKEIDRQLEGEMERSIERDVELELERQLSGTEGQRPPVLEGLAPDAAVKDEAAGGPPAPRGQAGEAPAGRKVHKRVALRNRQGPGGETRSGGEGRATGNKGKTGRAQGLSVRGGLVNAQPLANGNGLHARRGLSNGKGPSTGKSRTGMRNRKGLSNGEGLSNGNGLVNGRKGMVNGRRAKRPAATDGLVDANGFYNGRGMVNGRGITNGEGITNGRRMAVAEAPPPARRSTAWIIGSVVLAVVVVSAVVLVGFINTEKGVRIDGSFSDWSGVRMYSDDVADQANPEINIEGYAFTADGTYASFYVRTEGRALEGRNGGVDSAYFFLDTDQNPATGYRIGSAGAEYVMMVDGYDGHVFASGLYKFQKEQGRPQNDWNARAPVGSCRAAAGGRELEAQLSLQDIGMQGNARFNVLFLARDGAGGEDLTDVIGTDRISLKVSWSRIGPPSVQPGAAQVEMVRLELTAGHGTARVSSLRLSANDATFDTDVTRLALLSATGLELPGSSASVSGGYATLRLEPPLEVPAPGTTVVTVAVWMAPGAQTGKAIGLGIVTAADVAASTRTVSVEGRSLQMTYIGAAVPGRILIDGAFADWDPYQGHPDPVGDVLDPNIDVTDFKLANDSSSLYFYVKVGGQMMGGVGIPESKLRPSHGPGGPGGGPVTLPVLVGEDSLYVLIDADSSAGTGYSGGGLPIGADYMVNITGQYGRISSQRLHQFTGGADTGSWSWSAGTDVRAAADQTRLEAQISLGGLGFPAGNLTVFYYSTDWKQKRDTGGQIAYDLRSQGGRSLNGEGTDGADPGPPAGPDGRDGPALHAPEFQDVLLPLAGMTAAFVILRRARKR